VLRNDAVARVLLREPASERFHTLMDAITNFAKCRELLFNTARRERGIRIAP